MGGYSRQAHEHGETNHLTRQTVCRLDQLKWPSSLLPPILHDCLPDCLPVCLAKYAPLAPHPFSRCRNALLLTTSTLCRVSRSLSVVSSIIQHATKHVQGASPAAHTQMRSLSQSRRHLVRQGAQEALSLARMLLPQLPIGCGSSTCYGRPSGAATPTDYGGTGGGSCCRQL